MKRFLSGRCSCSAVVAVCGFGAFLYFIPPFFTTPPEDFGKAMADAPPPVDGIADPGRTRDRRARPLHRDDHRLHRLPRHERPAGPGPDEVSRRRRFKIQTPHGTFVSRNLTPDKETGLARRTDEEVKRVLRSGTFPDGHVAPGTAMPWPVFSNWTEEDRHAVVVYLRHLPAMRHQIPEPVPGNAADDPRRDGTGLRVQGLWDWRGREAVASEKTESIRGLRG